MRTYYVIIRANSEGQELTCDLPEQPSYDDIKRIVQPVLGPKRWMERVAVLHNGKACDMFVDECGAIDGLPPNPAATTVYRAWRVSKGDNPNSLPMIYGDAVLFTRRVWF